MVSPLLQRSSRLFQGFLILSACLIVAALLSPARAREFDESASIRGAGDFRWDRVGGIGGRGDWIQALALGRDGGIALADEAGVAWIRGTRKKVRDELDSNRMRASARDVNDLVVDVKGQLWIASDAGLYRWSPAERPVRRDLRGGEAANRIRRMVSLGARLVVATEAGAYWSSTGQVFQSLSTGGVSEPISLAAILPPASPGVGADHRIAPTRETEVWLYGLQGLTRIFGLETPNGLRVTRRERLTLPLPRSEAAPVDLHFDSTRNRVVLVYPDRFAISEILESPDSVNRVGPWIIHRPVFAPGARIARIAITQNGVVAATDRGLFIATDLLARFQRPAGASAGAGCHAVASGSFESADEAIVGCGTTIYRRVRVERPKHPVSDVPVTRALVRREPIPKDPPLADLRRRALAHAGLDRLQEERLRDGLRRRGWWPDLSIKAGVDLDSDERRHADQSFVSGDTRHLFDRTRDRATAYDASVQLDWSLGEVAYPSDSVDLSRELRQRLSLRDDVSDEIHQLYFERERLRERLASDAPLTPDEERLARSRAREMAAGLDAWTGGWVSQWREDRLVAESRGGEFMGD